MIRPATPEDIPRLVEMGERFWSASVYADRLPPVSPVAIAKILGLMLSSPASGVFVVADAGQPAMGMIGLSLYEHPFTGLLTAGELFWWMEPERRGQGVRLLAHAERWAREAGAQVIQMIAPTRDVERLYQRLGYGYLEAGYQKAIA